MSNGRSHRRRVSRARSMVSMFAGFSTTKEASDIETTKRLTHDLLIEQLGDRRRSGVRWRMLDADDPRAFLLLDGLDRLHSHREYHPLPDLGPNVGALPERDYEGVRAKMREFPDGVLVVAECESVL